MGDNYKKVKELNEKLKAEKAQAEDKEVVAKEKALDQLAVIAENSTLAQMYNASARMGSENLQGSAAYLKVHSAGRSTSNFLSDGTKPNDGWFFYGPTQEQFKEVECHILTISRGFKTKEKDPKTGIEKEKFNQLIGGIIINDGAQLPFIMFVNGKRLSPMWEFAKEISQWTKRKPIAIPMFAMTITMKTHEEKNDFSYSHVIDFAIAKSENGMPELVMDEGEFQYLKDNVSMTEEAIGNIIASREKDTEETQPLDARSVDHEVDSVFLRDEVPAF